MRPTWKNGNVKNLHTARGIDDGKAETGRRGAL